MKKIYLSAIGILAGIGLHGQTVTHDILSNNGDYVSTPGGSIAWTIGEPVVETYANSTNMTTNGFHQPDIDLVAMVHEQHNASLLVYPNPVRDELRISLNGMPAGNYDLSLCDAGGKQLANMTAAVSTAGPSYVLPMNEYAAGVYFLTIKSSTQTQTIKINKVY